MISVIIPAYNAQGTITNTVRSLQNQGNKDLQLIIVDDGSDDETLRVVSNLAASDFRIQIIHTENRGVAAARFTGIGYAQGDYISFIDSDDVVIPNMYTRLSEIVEGKKPDIISFGYTRRFGSGTEKEIPNRISGDLNHDEALIALIRGEITPSLWDKLFSKKLFDDIEDTKDAFEDIKINEDLLLNFILFSKASNTIGINDCLYIWNEREGSATTQTLNAHKIYDPIKVKQYIVTHVDERLYRYAKGRYLSSLINTYGTIALKNEPSYSEDQKTIRKMLLETKGKEYLSKGKRIQYNLIRYIPWLYRILLRQYRNQHKDTSFTEQ